MLLGYIPFAPPGGEERMELVILPSKPDMLSRPFRVDLLEPSEAGVLFIGPVEAITTNWVDAEKAMILETLPGTIIYLTPDTSERPGVGVRKVKIIYVADRKYEIHYARKLDDPYVKWEPLIAAR